MSKYTFDSIFEADIDLLRTDNYLWIWYADKIPPHLGISINGMYFSLKYNGKDLGVEVENPIKLILKRNISALFIKLNCYLNSDVAFNIFESFEKASSAGFTCLDPIQQTLSKQNLRTIFELLEELKMEQVTGSVYGLNLPDNYSGLPTYGVKEIRDRLLKLENASVGKHISAVS